MRISRLVLLSVLLVAGCASANRPLQLIAGAGQVYPQQAREQQLEGSVTVAYDVNVQGRVVNARVHSSEPQGVFDEAALAAVRSWRFNPALVEGVAQPSFNLHSTLTFKLGATRAYDEY